MTGTYSRQLMPECRNLMIFIAWSTVRDLLQVQQKVHLTSSRAVNKKVV